MFEVEALPADVLQSILRETIDYVLDIEAFNYELGQEKQDAAYLTGREANCYWHTGRHRGRLGGREVMSMSTEATATIDAPPGNGEGGNGKPIPSLFPHHIVDLQKSGISDETTRAAGLRSEGNRDKLAGIVGWKRWPQKYGTGLVFPFHDDTGAVVLQRIKVDNPRRDSKGRLVKYLQRSGSGVAVYFPPGVRDALAESDPKRELLVTEGEKKSLKAAQEGFPCIGLTGVDCWHSKRSNTLLPELERIKWQGREVYIVFDSDAADNQNVEDNACLLANQLSQRGAKVKIARLPAGPNGEKVGLDDYLVANDIGALRKLLDNAELPERPDPGVAKMPAKDAKPEDEAKLYLMGTEKDGHRCLRYWCETFYLWRRNRYREKPDSEVRASIALFLNHNYFKVAKGIISNVLEQVKAQSIEPSEVVPPVWLDEVTGSDWPTHELLVTRNKIVHLPSVASGKEYNIPVTPALFNTVGLDFDFVEPEAGSVPVPELWLEFLEQLWGDDPEQIAALQLWFGYCLTADTRQQKILGLFGPRRSGKGTIARVQRALVGPDNVAAPTLSSFATNFGLWPLVGKTLAIISDARLSGRADAAVIVERLLSISGEDALTIDRKNLRPITIQLPTRLMLLSNELPRLSDASGALVSRMIVLCLTKSWFGKEDRTLTGKLMGELPGILWWAIDGWRKLQERGHLLQPASGAEVAQEMEDLASPVGAFVREKCIVGPEHRMRMYCGIGLVGDSWEGD